MEALDSRLVALYDLDNPDGPDHDYYRALADEVKAHTIVDLGCGTGLLTVSLASGSRRVIGIDPDPEMLSVGRGRPGGERVEWVLGDSRAIGRVNADLVVMSGNVAQAILGEEWSVTLGDVLAALQDGGVLAFESRNPTAQAWTHWNRAETYGTRDTPTGRLTEWLDVIEVAADGSVTLEAHNIFDATGEHLVVTSTLAFRDYDQLTADLEVAGFLAASVRGGWQGEELDESSGLIVVQAQRRSVSA